MHDMLVEGELDHGPVRTHHSAWDAADALQLHIESMFAVNYGTTPSHFNTTIRKTLGFIQ